MPISKTKKELLCKYVKNQCEECGKVFKINDLRIHRINREWQNGTYEDFRNLKVVCVKCHLMYHANEYSNVRGK